MQTATTSQERHTAASRLSWDDHENWSCDTLPRRMCHTVYSWGATWRRDGVSVDKGRSWTWNEKKKNKTVISLTIDHRSEDRKQKKGAGVGITRTISWEKLRFMSSCLPLRYLCMQHHNFCYTCEMRIRKMQRKCTHTHPRWRESSISKLWLALK